MLTLKAEKRDIFGKKLEKLRTEGKMPVVVYGYKEKGSSFFVSVADFKKLWSKAGESTVVTLQTPEGDKDALIHDVAFHSVTEEPLHADFLAVDASKTTRVHVPLVFEGVSDAVKNLGGILVKVAHELEVEALPKDLPHEIKVNISSLAELNSHLAIKDIKLPPGVKVVGDPSEIVVSVAQPKEEKEETPAEVDLSAIEVEKKGKEETAEGEGEPLAEKPTEEPKKK